MNDIDRELSDISPTERFTLWRESIQKNCVKIKNPKKFSLDQIPTPKASVTSCNASHLLVLLLVLNDFRQR